MTVLRKRVGSRVDRRELRAPNAVDMESTTVLVTSEDPAHPVDLVFDGSFGPGASRWRAGEGGEQVITLEFEGPRNITRVFLEVEERDESRTQELVLSALRSGGRGFEELRRQEFVFDPAGATFERESWEIAADDVTHLRLAILPDKGRQRGRATLTALVVA